MLSWNIFGGSSNVSSDSDPGKALPSGGMRTALLITCSYPGQEGALPGTIHDGARMKQYLKKRGFRVTWMRDDKKGTRKGTCEIPECNRSRSRSNPHLCKSLHPWVENQDYKRSRLYPSKCHIEEQIMNLAANAARGDVIWVYFSGHGGQGSTSVSSEEDGTDEEICPTDYAEEGCIVDDWLNTNFAAKLPQGAQAVMMFDCCHSGTAVDLPYQYRKADGEWRRTRSANPDSGFVLYLSGCSDSQLSTEGKYDAGMFAGILPEAIMPEMLSTYKRGGALTTQFLSTAKKYGDNAPLKKYLDHIQSSDNLKENEQEPCLSSSHRISVKQSFSNFLAGGVHIRTEAESSSEIWSDSESSSY